MKRYEGFAAQKSGRREHLAPGGYVVKIMKAEDVSFSNGPCLMLSFDIAEGADKGFFLRDYRQNTYDNKKWRGVHYLNQPCGDGSEKDSWAIHAMNNFIAVVQESNPGFTWDWGPVEMGDYSQLKGKVLGALFGQVEWEYNGKTGWATKCRGLITAQDVRDGNFTTPADKPLHQSRQPAQPVSTQDSSGSLEDDDDLPF